ncbi:MAG: hypothetical protein ACFCU5_18740 [Pleurocapsa sp.]
MNTQIQKFTLAVTILLLSLVTVKTSPANASVLFTGKYASLEKTIKLISLLQREQILANLSQGNEILIAATETNNTVQKNQLIANSIVRRNTDLDINNELEKSLAQSVDNLRSAEELKAVTSNFVENFTSNSQKSKGLPNADQINQDLQNRYSNVVEADTETTGLIQSRKLLNFIDSSVAQNDDTNSENLKQTIALLQSQGTFGEIINTKSGNVTLPQATIIGILISIGLFTTTILAPLAKVFGEILDEGIIGDFKEKYGKPVVPEGSVFFHNRTLKELTNIAGKAEKLDSEKFGSAEFLLYFRIKRKIENKVPEIIEFNHSVELLRASIIAQKSFLRLEQTELRYRSRKQQEYYQFVTDNITDNVDKQEFRNKVKKKLAEIIPLINSEEGRNALEGYSKEVNIISQYDLGLKLIALFKKYQLADYRILKDVSDLVEKLEAKDLLEPKTLVSLVIEHYEIFEKLSPIIGIKEKDLSPETYSKVLQLIGLINRHEESYVKFKQLIAILSTWNKPHKSLIMVREEYTSDKYKIPPEFKQEIPGLNVYKKYEKYIEAKLT